VNRCYNRRKALLVSILYCVDNGRHGAKLGFQVSNGVIRWLHDMSLSTEDWYIVDLGTCNREVDGSQRETYCRGWPPS
jgi:hypothetical protein